MQEEMQILDGIQIILENGWIVKTDEMMRYFELLGIADKSAVAEENLKFLEFVYLIGRLFEVDSDQIKKYFGV